MQPGGLGKCRSGLAAKGKPENESTGDEETWASRDRACSGTRRKPGDPAIKGSHGGFLWERFKYLPREERLEEAPEALRSWSDDPSRIKKILVSLD